MSFNLKQKIPAISLFVFFLSLYVYTAAPGVYDGDSGEIAAAVNTLGLAHPTGFPLYMITGKLFTLIVPIRDVAYRLNIFSAILTAIALVFIYYTLKNLGNSSFASLIASFVLGLGRNTIWRNATTANVYTLSLFFASLLFFIFSKWRKEQKTEYLYWYGFLWGLSLGTHALMLIMVIPFLFMLWQERGALKKKISVLVKIIFLTVIPAVQYIYLIFAYKKNGIVNWGDLSSLDGFIYYITQRQYASKMFANTSTDAGSFLTKVTSLLTSEFTIMFFIIALTGLIVLFKKDKTLFVIFISIILANIGLMFGYGKSGDTLILFRYIFLIDLVLAVAIAYGLDVLASKVGILKNGKHVIFFTIIIVLIASFQFKNFYPYNNRRYEYIFEDFARNIFMSIEPDSILFAADDSIINPLWYLQSLGERNDVIILSAGLLNYDWYVKSEIKENPDIVDAEVLSKKWDSNRISHILNKNINNKNIYTTFTAWDDHSNSTFDFVPVGSVYAVIPKGNKDKGEILQKNQTLWDQYVLRGIKSDLHKDFTANQLIQHYALSLNNAGVVYANLGFAKEAIYFFKKSIDIIPDLKTIENLKKTEKNLPK